MSNTKLIWIAVILALGLGSALLVMNFRDLYKGIPAKIDPQDVQTTYEEWREFEPDDHSFAVMMPNLPQNVQETTMDDKTKEPVKYDLYVSEKNNGSLFIIMKKIYADKKLIGNPKAFLQEYLTEVIAANDDNKLINSKMVTYQGYDAINYAFQNNQTYVEGMAFVVDRMLYALSYTSRMTNMNLGDYQYFIDSFTLK